MITRRQLLKTFCALPLVACMPELGNAQEIVDFSKLKSGYAQRLKRILAAGELPYIDIESSCNSTKLDIAAFAKSMDDLNIGLMALSADIGNGQFNKGVRFDNLSERLLASYPDRFIPVGNGGQSPVLTEATDEFLDGQAAAAEKKQIMLLGEYEFRHYPSPREVKRNEMDRDANIPIDGPIGHRLFAMSASTGLPFQIHYEIEDALLAPLEKMLAQYPKAKVIWCHLAQVRYIERATRYSPSYVESLIKRYPNLYFDTAFGDAASVYPLSGQHHARVWGSDGELKAEWRDLIVAYSQRFLSALDLGGDRINRIVEYDHKHRDFLQRLPSETRHQVGYRSAWSLLFGEEFA
ncbi:amidohydrolase family protein [Sulfuriferula nivalis]|uniref:Amidohydrolase-related domain-containing protein n=1 Tax=Sulfuriferula nivalis TaxID=2675298 RepID=A0A809S0U6_9PROT|nr:amidohydrolase family protein [Sulfuriferula nivalis]BBP00128.1 hypothetical protein SFSGTM_08360 [Sulfuriferula nivalis]